MATFSLLSSYTASGSVSSVTFSNIDQTYSDLQVIVKGRSTRAFDNDSLELRPNASTSNSFALALSGNVTGSGGSSTSGFNFGSTTRGIAWASLTGGSRPSNYYSAITIYIRDYASTSLNKPMHGIGGMATNSLSQYKGFSTFIYDQNTAITSLQFLAANGNIENGSSFWLYGIKNS